MKKLFILVRKDLKRSSPAVQAGHAVAQFMLEYPNSEWKNGYLIYLKVRDLAELKYWKGQAMTCTINKILQVSDFSEPDLNNELTAVAIYGTDMNFFNSSLRLL